MRTQQLTDEAHSDFADVEVKASDIAGARMGLFAKKDLKEGDKLFLPHDVLFAFKPAIPQKPYFNQVLQRILIKMREEEKQRLFRLTTGNGEWDE